MTAPTKRSLTREEIRDRAEDRWYSMAELTVELTFARSSIYRLIERGELPEGAKILGNRTVWFDRDVRALKRSLCEQAA
ncbi:AlpA family phage regulatory protein [Citromicrobium bathyomarinum]